MERTPQNSPKTGETAEHENFEGPTLQPPAFQLKAAGDANGAGVVQRRQPQVPGSIRYLSDILRLTPVATVAAVRTSIQPWQIMNTDEFQELMNPTLAWQRDYQLSYDQAVQTCYAILEEMVRTSGTVNWQTQALSYVRTSIRRESVEEGQSHANTALVGNLRTLVDTFRREVTAATTVAAIRTVVQTRGPELWTTGRTQTQALPPTGLSRADRPMYWARNEMRSILRANALLRQDANLSQLQQLIRLLEDNSRGSGDLAGFTSAPAGLKRILITGFDPFDGGTTNPSGIVAQRLDGQRVPYGGADAAIIEALTFPVRYDDFDHGMVERLVGPIINRPDYNVSLVITISLSSLATTLNLDRYSANTRFGHPDNDNIAAGVQYPPHLQQDGTASPAIRTGLAPAEYLRMANETRNFLLQRYPNVGTVPNVPAITSRADLVRYLEGPVASFYQTVFRNHFQPRGDAGAEFIPSNMPLDAMMGDANMPATARVDQGYTSMDSRGRRHGQSGTGLARTPAEVRSSTPPDASHVALDGSGGNYLSNEIYHRVSTLRSSSGRTIRNVHIHIPNEGNQVEGAAAGTTFTADRIVREVQQIIGVAAHHN